MFQYQDTIHLTQVGKRCHYILLTIALWVLVSSGAYAAPMLSPTCGTGSGNIPDATVDGLGNITPGVLTCGFLVNTAGTIAGGNAVTVSLLGFRHESSGDVGITLTHYTDATKTVMLGGPQWLFYRIGKVSNDPNDFGYTAQFGDPLGTGDNYEFGSAFSTNLWTVAGSLGTADFIPGQSGGFTSGYATTDPFSSTPNAFSSMFAGQTLSGYWQLEITDYAPGPSSIPIDGSLLQWGLNVTSQISVPEPRYGLGVLAALAILLGRRKKI